MTRIGPALVLLLTLLICSACDSAIAFYISNKTDQLHYVRVTVNRTGGVYVHQVDPGASGYAVQGVDPGPGDDGDVYSVELLDAECNPIREWSMPSTGGYLEIADPPEFVPGYFETPPGSDSAGGVDPSLAPGGLQHPTVLECGATDTLP
jgi:hypothetical protein